MPQHYYSAKEHMPTMVPSWAFVANRIVQMKNEASYYQEKWREAAIYFAPYSLRLFEDFTSTPRNAGLRNRKIRNTIGQQAKSIFAAGFQSLACNPAEKWFRMEPAIEANIERDLPGSEQSVSDAIIYADKLRDAALKILPQTAFYRVTKSCFEDIFWSAGMAFLQEEDAVNVSRFRHLPVGSYLVALDFNGIPEAMAISHPMTASQIVMEFGEVGEDGMKSLAHLPSVVQELNKYKSTTRFQVYQYIQRNPEYIEGAEGLMGKAYISIWYFWGGGSGEGVFGGNLLHRKALDAKNRSAGAADIHDPLRIEGTDFNPMFFCPWDAKADDTYGHECPGELSLGWLKQLQHGELRIGQAIDHAVAPHLFGHSGLQLDTRSVFGPAPGGITLVNDMKALEHGLQPTHTMALRIDYALNNQDRMEGKVRDISFTNLILKISELSKSNVTATEINALRNEQLVILVPTYGLMQERIFDRVIENTLLIAERQGKLPEMPRSLVDAMEKTGAVDVNMAIEYTSTLAQAQKLTKLTSLERTVGLVSEWSDTFPNLPRKFKTESLAGHLVETTGAPADLIVPDEEYFAALEQDSQQAQEEESLDNQKIAAETAKIQSETAPPPEDAATGVDAGAILGGL